MKKFRLQPVLKLRQYAEELRKRDLAEALAEEQRRKDFVLRIAESRNQQTALLRQQQEQSEVDVRNLIEHRQYIGLLDREIRLNLRHVAAAEQQTATRKQAVVSAMRDRKAVETLRQHFNERMRQQGERLETIEMDEVAAMSGRTTAAGLGEDAQ